MAAVPAAGDENGPAEEERRRFIDPANDAFVATDAAGTTVEWSPQAERMFGWARSEAVGRPIADLIVAPASQPRDDNGIERVLTDGTVTKLGKRFELLARHREGHVFPVQVTAWLTDEDGCRRLHAFVQDLTRQRKAEEELHRLADIIESSAEAIVSANLRLEILTWNRGAERLYGFSRAEAMGQPLTIIAAPEHHDELRRLLNRVRRGMPVHQHEAKGCRKNEVQLDVSLTISPVCDVGGDMTGFSVVARDITEQRWMAATLNATLQSLEQALAESQESEARLRRFTADAAHQLRTPIAGIRACAETLMRDPSTSERDALLADVIRETARAGRLMGGLLKMARIDQGQALTPTRCDVVALCSEEVDRARALAPHLEVQVEVRELPATRPELDGHAVREILSNLLDNARRHATSRIEVVVASQEDHVELKVADDGPGVAPDMVERIFERFVSADGKGGSGLGLPIARGLARAHGGDLSYERAFVLRLPLEANRDCGGAGCPDFAPVDRSVDDWGLWLSS